MKKTLVLFALAAASLRCASVQGRYDRMRFGENPYIKPPFYTRYLDPSNPNDQQIQQLLEVLQNNPASAPAHNELGALLAAKGFPKDAEREFRRAVAADRDFYPAWYNLALIREGRGDSTGAVRALRGTLARKPGHALAHFQLGLIYEKRGRNELAVHHYAKAFTINRALLDVRTNPRIVDAQLIDRALLKMYPTEHARRILRFQPTPDEYVPPARPEPQPAPSRQAAPEEIVTPAPPVTEPSQQPPPPPPPPPGR